MKTNFFYLIALITAVAQASPADNLNARDLNAASESLHQLNRRCDIACSVTPESGGRCYYTCGDGACGFSPGHNRDQFLNGLAARGYDCKPEAYNTLSCAKTSAFGDCSGHKWTCGSGC